MIAQASEDGNTNTPALNISKNELRKVMRYVQSQSRESRKQQESTPRSAHSSPSSSNWSEQVVSEVQHTETGEVCSMEPTEESLASPGTQQSPSSDGFGSLTPARRTSLDIELFNSMLNQHDEEPHCKMSFLEPLLYFSQGLRNTEFLIETTGYYFGSKLFCVPREEKAEVILGGQEASMNKQFWVNVENGIYLWKIARTFPDKQRRALHAFGTACELVRQVLISEPLDFGRRLFYTLSPTNTSVYPPLRQYLLKNICQSSKEIFGLSHPLTMICNALIADEDDAVLSRKVLHRMYDVSSDQLGQSHPVSYKMMQSIVTTTRRAGELESAKQLAETSMALARVDHGRHSDQARLASKDLANILTCLGEHDRALSLQFQIVTKEESRTAPHQERPFHEDSISMYAMEDIAEYYDRHVNNLESSATWLRRAQSVSRSIWGETVTTGHISDKLDYVLRRLQAE